MRLPSKPLRDFAVFEALREEFGEGWQNWPEAFHHPESKAVKAFAKKNAKRVAFHAWLQGSRGRSSTARRAMRTSSACRSDFMSTSRWAPIAAVRSMVRPGRVRAGHLGRGAARRVQPARPGLEPAAVFAARAARKGFRPFIELLRANMPVGGALRMDHIMALSRLWWIPQGEKPERGGYVAYPFRELLAILAAEPARALPRDRRGPGHGPGRAPRRAQPGGRALVPAAAFREGLVGRVQFRRRLSARGAGVRDHARPADLARLLGSA